MSKVVLVQINHSEDHSEKILPLGILSIGSALKGAGFEIELVNITEKEIVETASSIVSKKPLYVGLSVMTGRQTAHSANLSKKIKILDPGLPIVWGGIHPSLLPEQCLSEDYIDYVVMGEGEETSIEFTNKLQNKESLDEVLGLGYKKGGNPRINPGRPFIKDLGQWCLDWNLIDLEKFIFPLDKFKRVIAYKTSRGCPFNCAFCYNQVFNQNHFRAWPVDQVVQDINHLKEKYKIDAIKFYDDNFMVDKNRAFEILRRIKLPAHLEARIDIIDDNLAREFKEQGVFDMLIGVESGSDRILKLINKRITVDQILKAVKTLARYNVPATYSAIVGLPTETKEEFEATVNLFYKIYKIHPGATITLGAYMPYPGSSMYNLAIKKGFIPPQGTEDWGKIDRFRKDFFTPWVEGEIVWRIREYFKLLKFKLGPINKWWEWRLRHRFFVFPLDIYLVEWLSGIAIEQKSWLGRSLRRVYNFIKNR